MESIVFFGKGGIGKSTIASNVTVLMAVGGGKVLHAGCDPKMDSTLSLMGRHIQPFTARSGNSGEAGLRESIFASPVQGVHCIEAGGPLPGVGCAGTGIGAMLDAMKDGKLLERDGYTAAVFDVLGDVVCGGFAAPLRRGFAKKAVIVTSEDPLSLYAANRLIMMIESYARNGVYLAGLAVNAKTPDGARLAEEFARAVNTRVLGVILRDPVVTAAEREHRPAVLAHPKSDFARRAARLALTIRAAGAPKTPPRPLPELDFFDFIEGRAPGSHAGLKPGQAASRAPARGKETAAALFERAGFAAAGLEGGQLLCDWKTGNKIYKVVIAPASSVQGNLARFSDWAVCFHPSSGDAGRAGPDLERAAAILAPLRFKEMLSALMGMKDFYGGLTSYALPAQKGKDAEDTTKRPHIFFGQWQRFIFPVGGKPAFIPPGSVMVEHGDNECRFCYAENGMLDMYSGDAGLNARGRDLAARGPLLPRGDGRIVNTDFQSGDAVFGDEDKMRKSLSDAAAQAGKGGLVEFYVGCSPMLLASDAAFFAREAEKDNGVTVTLENYNSFSEHGDKKTAVRADFMAKKLARAGAKPARDVNFTGYGRSARAMAALLAERGLSSVDAGAEFYSGARSAALQVLAGPDAVLGPAFNKAGMRWLLPPAPYGFGGTDAWLKAIAAALGKKIKAGPAPAQKAAALACAGRARNFAAGFVLNPGELGFLTGSGPLRTVPVLPVLAEAGFRLRLFVMDGPSAEKTGIAGDFEAGLAALKKVFPSLRLTVDLFKTPDGLDKLLRSDKTMRLVYSDISRDPRIVSAGRNPFTAALFQPGYAGALETWRRLLELCDWDFNERYLLAK